MARFLSHRCLLQRRRRVTMDNGTSADRRGHLHATGRPASSAGEWSGGPWLSIGRWMVQMPSGNGGPRKGPKGAQQVQGGQWLLGPRFLLL